MFLFWKHRIGSFFCEIKLTSFYGVYQRQCYAFVRVGHTESSKLQNLPENTADAATSYDNWLKFSMLKVSFQNLIIFADKAHRIMKFHERNVI